MNFLTSPDTRAVADALLAVPVGETITYAAMSKALGANIKARWWICPAAIKLANREAGAIFTNIRRVGYQRMAAENAAAVGATARSHIRRIASRSATTMGNAIQFANDLPEKARVHIAAEMSSMALLSHITKEAQVKTIPPSQTPQPVAFTLSALVQNIRAG